MPNETWTPNISTNVKYNATSHFSFNVSIRVINASHDHMVLNFFSQENENIVF